MEKEDNTAVLLSVISAISDELDCCYLFMLFSAFLEISIFYSAVRYKCYFIFVISKVLFTIIMPLSFLIFYKNLLCKIFITKK